MKSTKPKNAVQTPLAHKKQGVFICEKQFSHIQSTLRTNVHVLI